MKQIKDNPDYFVTEDGRIWSNKRKNFLKSFNRNINGYPSVNIYTNKKAKMLMIHHVVLENFVGPRPKNHVAAHLDGNPRNNNLSNLRWVTTSENMQHKKLHGTNTTGEKNGNSVLTKEKAQFILDNDNYSDAELARFFSVSEFTVSCIRKRKTWLHLRKWENNNRRIMGFKKDFLLKYCSVVDDEDMSKILGVSLDTIRQHRKKNA